MAKNLALLGFVIIIGFVTYRVIADLTSTVAFEKLKWDPFHVEAPPPVFSSPPVSSPSPARGGVFISKPPSKPKEEKPKIIPPLGFEIGNLSPNYRKVRLTSVNVPRNPYERGQFTLKAEHNLSSGINVSGWKIRTNGGGEVFIPKAIADYNPLYYLPPEGDIVLYPGDYLNVYSWSNRFFGGRNFRLNKCIGFLKSIYNFDPKLPGNCPTPDQSEIITFSGRCQTFIRSLNSCDMPTANELNSFSGPSDLTCRAYLERLNYRYCYEANRNKADFFSHEWRAWLNVSLPFDREHDRLLLFDKDGGLVDEYVY
jgi:hypothetical protein